VSVGASGRQARVAVEGQDRIEVAFVSDVVMVVIGEQQGDTQTRRGARSAPQEPIDRPDAVLARRHPDALLDQEIAAGPVPHRHAPVEPKGVDQGMPVRLDAAVGPAVGEERPVSSPSIRVASSLATCRRRPSGGSIVAVRSRGSRGSGCRRPCPRHSRRGRWRSTTRGARRGRGQLRTSVMGERSVWSTGLSGASTLVYSGDARAASGSGRVRWRAGVSLRACRGGGLVRAGVAGRATSSR
jgi:hypothetical protein